MAAAGQNGDDADRVDPLMVVDTVPARATNRGRAPSRSDGPTTAGPVDPRNEGGGQGRGVARVRPRLSPRTEAGSGAIETVSPPVPRPADLELASRLTSPIPDTSEVVWAVAGGPRDEPTGLIDVICPMAYTTDPAVFAAQIAAAKQIAGSHPLWAGIGAYRLSSDQIVENAQTARRLGVGGIILFSYDSLADSAPGPGFVSRVGRAAFQ